MKLLTADETAGRLGISPRSLLDKRYRFRLGLPAVKIGRRIGFSELDVERLIAQGREKLPAGKETEMARRSKAADGVVGTPCEHIG